MSNTTKTSVTRPSSLLRALTDGVLETEEDAGDATGEDEGDGQQDDEGTEDGDEDIGDSEAEADDEPDDEAREETTEQTEAGTVDASLEDLPAEKPATAEEARELWQLQREISEWREAQGARRSLVPRKCPKRIGGFSRSASRHEGRRTRIA